MPNRDPFHGKVKRLPNSEGECGVASSMEERFYLLWKMIFLGWDRSWLPLDSPRPSPDCFA